MQRTIQLPALKQWLPNEQLWSALPLIVPSARYFALFAVCCAAVLPPKGFGLDVCYLHAVSGLPCPGCGLTRAFIAVMHGHFSDALALNPFVTVIFPLFVVLSLLCFLPERAMGSVEGWLSLRARTVSSWYRVWLTAFLVFGAARFVVFLALGERFP